MKITNNYNLPQPLYDIIVANNTGDPYTEQMTGKTYFRVTDLIKPPRIRTLKQRYDDSDKLVVDASELLNVTLGTAVHELMEGKDTDDVVYECGVGKEFDIDGQRVWVVGTADEYRPQENKLIDVKTAGIYSNNYPIDETYIQQVNIYAFLLGMFDQETDPRLYIRYWYKDWTKAQAAVKEGYPPCAVQVRAVLPMSVEEVETLIIERLKDHLFEPDRLCTSEERAFGGAQWSVVKKKDPQGRAVRNFDTRQEAEEWYLGQTMEKQMDLMVTHRGKDTQCKMYCDVRTVCPYAIEQGYVV